MAEMTPMMKQYLEMKEENKDTILFFRVGDFYEMFFDDAILASRELELTLTGKDCGQEERAPMCGVPYHAAETYISRLVKKGHKVAICEQIEDPKLAKGLVKRDIIRVVTPGTVIDSIMLDEKNNNYICSIYKLGINFGLASADVTTGEISCTEFLGGGSFMSLIDELARIKPSEIVVNSALFYEESEIGSIRKRFNSFISMAEDEFFDRGAAVDLIKKHIEKFVENKERFSLAYISTGALLRYLSEIQKANLEHINNLDVYESEKYMSIDMSTRRNLEITETMREKSRKGTLLWVVDNTNTAMGARMIHSWLERPLIDVNKINKRNNAVEVLKNNPILRSDVIEKLNKIYDIERLSGRVVYGSANGRDLVALKLSLKKLPEIKEILAQFDNQLLNISKNESIFSFFISSILQAVSIL